METKQTPKYLTALDECLKEMSVIRKNMKKQDAEIRRLESSTRRKLDETKAIISRVQAII
ncbi:MAG TPA: hypothetical protein VG754_07160 [Verrucomicrobiae bacterium]|nr:hypothetical protein [Verrucomicrobiae bacterium]